MFKGRERMSGTEFPLLDEDTNEPLNAEDAIETMMASYPEGWAILDEKGEEVITYSRGAGLIDKS